ncbi:MAG: hypothetical protein LBU27_00805 [Candidatus Peribacteria bacterium]|jgi:hypothetical protein|nr:hypothetical protein [Candidatus Peribacteria bacterium]
MKKGTDIYIVRLMSTGISRDNSKYSKSYLRFAVIDTGGGVKEKIEIYRKFQENAFQEANAGIEVVTRVVSTKKIKVFQAITSK